MNKIVLLLFLLLIFFVSCSSEKKDYKREIAKKQLIDNISRVYDASITFDTVDYEFTYQYQELLKKNSKVIINNFRIIDIAELDSGYNLFCARDYWGGMSYNIFCPKSQILKFIDENSQIVKLRYSTNYYLILKIKSINKIKFELDAHTSYEECEIRLEYGYRDNFMCEAELLDFIEAI